jgi:NAD(P)-dependent dehydrogenase (short-subunit alcohol dehydrogenase family)
MKAAGATVVATDVAAPDRAEADHVLAHDVTSQADWQAVAELVQSAYGRLDALVNVAGSALSPASRKRRSPIGAGSTRSTWKAW